MLPIHKLNNPPSTRLERWVITKLSRNVLHLFVLQLTSLLEVRLQVVSHLLLGFRTESFPASTFFSLHSILRPSLDVFAWNLQFSTHLDHRTMVLEQHLNGSQLLLDCVVLVWSSLVLLSVVRGVLA